MPSVIPRGKRAAARSTRLPRSGTPSFRRRASCLRPRVTPPSERTTRCHGTLHSVVASMRPTRRGARGSISPYVWTKPSGIAQTRSRMRAARDLSARAFDAAFERRALDAIALAILAMMTVMTAHGMSARRTVRDFNLFHLRSPAPATTQAASLDGRMDSPHSNQGAWANVNAAERDRVTTRTARRKAPMRRRSSPNARFRARA
jgi:hypothetical protein